MIVYVHHMYVYTGICIYAYEYVCVCMWMRDDNHNLFVYLPCDVAVFSVCCWRCKPPSALRPPNTVQVAFAESFIMCPTRANVECVCVCVSDATRLLSQQNSDFNTFHAMQDVGVSGAIDSANAIAKT